MPMSAESSEDLITERARVLRIENGVAWVQCESQAGCARCAAGEGCGGGLFAKLLRGRLEALPVPIPPDFPPLAVDSGVLVGLSTAAVQNAAFLVYGLPLAGLLLGALAGSSLLAGNDAAAFAGAALGFAAGLLLARRKGETAARATSLQPVLLRVLRPGEPCPAGAEARQ